MAKNEKILTFICLMFITVNGLNTSSVIVSDYCPPYCECEDGSDLPAASTPTHAHLRHVYCHMTDMLFNVTDEMNMATESNISTLFDILIKCYGNTEIIWSTSAFLNVTFSFRMINCNILNEGPVLLPEVIKVYIFILDTFRPEDIAKLDFRRFTYLKLFQISNSNITTIPNLPVLPSLSVLSLKRNHIEELDCNIFEICLACYIDLTGNIISLLPNCHLNKRFITFVKLNVADNIIVDIEHVNTLELATAVLSYNQIAKLPKITNRNLYNLTVSHNNLTEIQTTSFPKIIYLRYLDLSFNQIRSIDVASFSNLINLKELSLTGNKLLVFDHRYTPYAIAMNDIYIHLNYNHLKYPPFNTDIVTPRNTLYIKASENPFICDCEIVNLNISSRIIFVDKNDMRCKEPRRLRNNPIYNITFISPCPVVNKCPLSCECDYHSSTDITVINCSHLSWSSLPSEMPVGELHLNFTVNQIDVLDRRAYFTRTQQLDLSSNKITNVTSTGLSLLSNVKRLDLQRNEISELPRTVIDVRFTNDTVIYLSDNPWKCSCDLLWFSEWLISENSLVGDRNELQCHLFTPSRQVVDMTSSELDCQPHSQKYMSYVIPYILLFIIIIAVASFICKFRFEVKVLLYTRLHLTYFGPTPLLNIDVENREYDVFIAYCDEDLQWVKDTLLRRLENVEKPAYKTIVPDRDFLVGESVVESVNNAVCNSYCTMIIFSTQFQQSEWCLYYFHRAYEHMLKEGNIRIVVIMKDKCDISKIDDDMQAYFKAHTYLDINDKLFWDKLSYSLPKHHPSTLIAQEHVNDPLPLTERN